MRLRSFFWLAACLLLTSCAPRPEAEARTLTIAAAANLTDVLAEIGRAFRAKTGITVVYSFGATAQLAQQIENGAPFDLFASADTEHIDSLAAKQQLLAGSRAVYAIGQLAVWAPKGGIASLQDLASEHVRYIGVAQPDLAPYGQASVEALKASGLWEAVQSKIVYANSISQVKQLAASGNADAAFTAYSLLLKDQGTVLKIDPSLHRPIEQALGIPSSTSRADDALRFRSFLLGPEGREILARYGYLLP